MNEKNKKFNEMKEKLFNRSDQEVENLFYDVLLKLSDQFNEVVNEKDKKEREQKLEKLIYNVMRLTQKKTTEIMTYLYTESVKEAAKIKKNEREE